MVFAEVTPARVGAADTPRVPDEAPVSTIPYRDGYLGLGGLCLGWLLVMMLRPEPLTGAWIAMLATGVPMLIAELRRARPANRRRQGLAPLAWVVGFIVATLPFLAFHVQATDIFSWSVVWFVVAPAFAIRLAVEWSRSGTIYGGFPVALGRALLRPSRQKLAALAVPARLWALKAIFIPLYAVSLVGLVRLALMADLSQPIGWLGLAVIFLYTVDLSFGVTGYVFASNELVPTVRSTQRSIVGWAVCLLCYGPIFAHWPAFEAVVHAEIGWTSLLVMTPLAIVGSCALLVLLLLYVWASVVFGMRFSNLSNRGVVTAGPYRLMKHPAYFAHVANSWIIALILMPAAGIDLGATHWLVPVAFTLLYWARSRTEEQHMREDPDYVAYSGWIARHGFVAGLKRLIGLGERQERPGWRARPRGSTGSP